MTELNVNGNQIQEKVKLKQSEETAKQVASDPAAQNPEVRAAKADLKLKGSPVRDEFNLSVRKNGYFERLVDVVKNKTGYGIGSNKAEAAIQQFENGEISEDQALAVVDKYRKSQCNSAQLLGDAASVGAAGVTFFSFLPGVHALEGFFKLCEKNKLLPNPEAFAEFINNTTKSSSILKKFANGALCGIFGVGKELKCDKIRIPQYSKNKALIGLTLFAGLIAGTTKATLLTANRIGSKEFKADKKEFNGAKTVEDKRAYLKEKKRRSKGKFGSFLANNFRDGFTGAVNGLMMPITTLCGGLAGVPLYLAGNTLTRFFVGNKEEDDKSLAALGENLKNNAAETGVFALAAGIPLAIKAHNFSAFEKNFNKAVDKLSTSQLNKVVPEISESKNIEKLFTEECIDKYKGNYNYEEIASDLIEDNLIMSKFIQVTNSENSTVSRLAKQMQDSIKPTRTIEEAGALLKNSTNARLREATVEKCIGSATVAETYSVRYKDGTVDVVKMIRKGFDDAKVDRDLQKSIEIVERRFKGPDEIKQKLIKQLRIYAESLKAELNLNNELNNAKSIAKSTKKAMVVKPGTVEKIGDTQIYVMEHARGMNLKIFCEMANSAAAQKTDGGFLKVGGALNNAFSKEKVDTKQLTKEINERGKAKLERLIEKMSQTREEADALREKILKLNREDLKFFMQELQDVIAEQFGAITTEGKVIHGDIHPGNMFVDLDAVLNRQKGKVFTLIDTGNAINLSAKEAENMLRISTCIQHGDAEGIVNCLSETLPDSAFPAGKREEIVKSVVGRMKELFTNNTENLTDFSKEGITDMVVDLFRKQNVQISSDTMLQYTKSFNSAKESLNTVSGAVASLNLGEMNFINSASTACSTYSALTSGNRIFETVQAEAVRNLPAGSEGKWLSQSAPKEDELMLFNLKKAIAQSNDKDAGEKMFGK